MKGKTLTSWPSLRPTSAMPVESGGTARCSCVPTQGFDLVTSRNPDDLDAFEKTLFTTFARVR